jgi:ribonuclease VapC
MIVLDTSSLMAIVLKEPRAAACIAAAEAEPDLAISAGTAAEAMIVADGRGVGNQMRALIGRLAIEIVPVTFGAANLVADAYRRWGKGNHRAGLNLGDCFAYALANDTGGALLFVGDDFSKTDIKPALS